MLLSVIMFSEGVRVPPIADLASEADAPVAMCFESLLRCR